MIKTNYDSELCGSLPIHLINLIQPHGVLAIVEKQSRIIVQVSENAADVFEVSFEKLINTSIDQFLAQPSIDLLVGGSSDMTNKIPNVLTINQRTFLTQIHQKENYIILEIDSNPYDETKQESFLNVYKEIKYSMALIQGASSIQEVANNCVQELKRISGFDKIMLYKFDLDWNGTVLAEVMEPGMESYLGITFPASDVPQQARALYLRNAFRLIPTRDYQPVKLFPVINPLTHSFVDLSDCNLRSVPAVHLEYLRNMHVMASMSTRILSGNKLWGLIACHHRTEKNLSFEMRSVFELFSDFISSKISSLQNDELHYFNAKIREHYKNIIEESFRGGDLAQALLKGESDILTLFNATGALICIHGKMIIKGVVPDSEKLSELILWLHTKQLKQVFHTDSLSSDYDRAIEFKEVASGVLVVPIDADSDEYVILFRPEVVRVINWGGNPEERIQFDAGQKNYHPRNSFAQWQQMVEASSLPWRDEEVFAAENLRSFIYEFSN